MEVNIIRQSYFQRLADELEEEALYANYNDEFSRQCGA